MENALTPEKMPFAADEFVAMAKTATGFELDYSPASIRVVDWILDDFHTKGQRVDTIRAILFACGAYVGEVVRRHHGGEWRAVSTLKPGVADKVKMYVSDLPVIFDAEDGIIQSPYDKVIKRVENGAPDSIIHWANAATGIDFVPSDEFDEPKTGLLARIFGKKND